MVDIIPLRKVFRRKKRHQGGTWTPERSPAMVGDGAWCSKCRMRHGFHKMLLGYEKRSDGSGYKLLWGCPLTGEVILEG